MSDGKKRRSGSENVDPTCVSPHPEHLSCSDVSARHLSLALPHHPAIVVLEVPEF